MTKTSSFTSLFATLTTATDKIMMKTKLLACFALTTILALQAQPAPTSLKEFKMAVQFEIEQKDSLKLTGGQLNDTFSILARTQVDDDQIIKTIKLRKDLEELIQKLDDTNARQAALAEQIKQATSSQNLSLQENKIYRQCGIVLTELAHAQNKLLTQADKQHKALVRFLKRLPPPQQLILENGIEFNLVSTPEATFYASQIIPDTMAPFAPNTHTNPKLNIVTPTWTQANDILNVIRRQTLLPLALPTRTHIVAMVKQNNISPCAIWCREPFSARQSLKFKRATDNTPTLQRMTPAQKDAMTRFKVKFAMVWDPRHLLSKEPGDFIRELPQACHACLGMLIVAPANIGSQKRLERLNQRLNDKTKTNAN